MDPVTRKELYLAKLSGLDIDIPDPVTREEMFLAKLCGVDVETPSPITRYETFLNELVNGEFSNDPITRLEKMIVKSAGIDIPAEQPVTREEYYWSNIEAGDQLNTFVGSIVRFSAKHAKNIKSIQAAFSPKQNLNGQDAPYPPGCGKNLLKITNSNVYSHTIDGVEFTVVKNDANSVLSIAAKGTATARVTMIVNNTINNDLESGEYILSGCPSGGGSGKYRMTVWDGTASATLANDYGSGKTFTLDNTHNVNCAIDITSGQSIDAVFYPMIRLSTESDATFAPYSNPCQIEGYTGADIYKNGVNLWDCNRWYGAGSGTQITKGVGSIRMVNTSGTRYAGANAIYESGVLNYEPFKKGGKFICSFDISGTLTTSWMVGLRKKSNNTFISANTATISTEGHYTFSFDVDNLAENCYISASRTGNSTDDFDVTISNFQIEVGETESAYEPFNQSVVSVLFPALGNNLLDELNSPIYGRYIKPISNVWSKSANSCSYAFPCKPETTYTISASYSSLSLFRFGVLESEFDPDSDTEYPLVDITRLTEPGSGTITTSANAKYIIIQANSIAISEKYAKIQVELGSTATPYEPYNPVYKGTLTINGDGSGNVAVDTKRVVFDGVSTGKKMTALGQFDGVPCVYAPFVDGYEFGRDMQPNKAKAEAKGAMCSHLGYADLTSVSTLTATPQSYFLRNNANGTLQIRLYNENFSTLEEYNTWLNDLYTGRRPLQVTYPLATPIIIPLTAQQIKTLVGKNTVWVNDADGDITIQAYGTEIA